MKWAEVLMHPYASLFKQLAVDRGIHPACNPPHLSPELLPSPRSLNRSSRTCTPPLSSCFFLLPPVFSCLFLFPTLPSSFFLFPPVSSSSLLFPPLPSCFLLSLPVSSSSAASSLPSTVPLDFLLIICCEKDESFELCDSLARNPCKIRPPCICQFPEIVSTLWFIVFYYGMKRVL